MIGIADQVGATCSAPVFIRAGVPMAPSGHQLIVARSAGMVRRPVDDVVYDLGLDELDSPPSSAEVGERWRDADGTGRFSISTVGFDPLDAGELIALATLACVSGATAIVTDRVRSVRRVVDTVTPIMAAGTTPDASIAEASVADNPETVVG